MHQLKLLPPTRQAEVILLVSSQPRLMGTLAVASPPVHETVQHIAGMEKKQLEANIKVQTRALPPCCCAAYWNARVPAMLVNSMQKVLLHVKAGISEPQASKQQILPDPIFRFQLLEEAYVHVMMLLLWQYIASETPCVHTSYFCQHVLVGVQHQQGLTCHAEWRVLPLAG